ncbi:MAG: zinc ribbon domain-containing protein, partial [Candidatus Woesearchaeota archaeon]
NNINVDINSNKNKFQDTMSDKLTDSLLFLRNNILSFFKNNKKDKKIDENRLTLDEVYDNINEFKNQNSINKNKFETTDNKTDDDIIIKESESNNNNKRSDKDEKNFYKRDNFGNNLDNKIGNDNNNNKSFDIKERKSSNSDVIDDSLENDLESTINNLKNLKMDFFENDSVEYSKSNFFKKNKSTLKSDVNNSNDSNNKEYNFCPKCGEKIRENSNFCSSCGYSFVENENMS